MISILVITPIVLSPFTSHSLANFSPSAIAKSWLAGMTHKMMVLGSPQYLPLNNSIRFGHFSGELLNVGLTLDVNSSDTRQINDSEIRTIHWINSQLYGIINDVASSTCYFISKFLDVVSNCIKIRVFFIWAISFKYRIRFSIGVPFISGKLLGSIWTNRS